MESCWSTDTQPRQVIFERWPFDVTEEGTQDDPGEVSNNSEVVGLVLVLASFIFNVIFVFFCSTCCCICICVCCTQYGERKNERELIIGGESIGTGVFGAVFKGKYKRRPCAVKLLTHHAQQVATQGAFHTTLRINATAVKTIQKECNVLKELQHDNIVHLFAIEIEPKCQLPMMVMELMDCNLKEYIVNRQGEKLPLLYQLSLCLDISKGLEYLHSKNYIHRDLCDVNILIALKTGGQPKAKVADFGMSRLLPHDYISATLTELTHRQVYLPPEAPDDHYGYTLDIYSFGVVSVQIIQLKEGFKRRSEVDSALDEISDTHCLKSIVTSCLSQDRKSRPQAADIVNVIIPNSSSVVSTAL